VEPCADRSPRLIATDIDGTIVPSQGTVSTRTRAALHQCIAAGIEVVLVTGRPPRWLPPVVQATGLHGPIISANGAIGVKFADTWNRPEIFLQFPIPPDVARAAIAEIRVAVPDAIFAVETSDGLRTGPGYEEARGTGPREGLTPIRRAVTVTRSVEEMLDGGEVIKLVAISPESAPDQLLEIGRDRVGHLVSVTRSSTGRALLELGAQGVTKASTLELFAQSRGISPAEVIAFGDMPNDVEMLRWAGCGFAMRGGHPEALAAADLTAPPAEEDGVAQVLEKVLALRA